jgi:hypothetical protein
MSFPFKPRSQVARFRSEAAAVLAGAVAWCQGTLSASLLPHLSDAAMAAVLQQLLFLSPAETYFTAGEPCGAEELAALRVLQVRFRRDRSSLPAT